MVMDLEELKRQNAEAAAAGQEAQPDPTEVEEVQADDEDPEAEGRAAEAAEGEEPEAKDVPAWMATDDQTSESGQVPVKSHIAVKQKLKGRLREKDSEIERLRVEVDQLKGTAAKPAELLPAGQNRTIPKLEDFYDKPDPDSAYQVALQSWINQGVEQQLQQHFQTHQQQQQQTQQNQQVNQALDQHYDRAAKIVSDGLLSADEYQNSETLVRQTVENIAPGNGDTFVDALLARMGEGSEKVIVSLARNAQNLQKFRQSLQDDPTGISAASYLGELKGKFSGVAQRVSKTPRPGSKLKGDSKADGPAMRKYKAAHKAGNRQEAFDIKYAAKKSGVDVSSW